MEYTELDRQIALYVLFSKCLTDVLENGVEDTKLSDETRPAITLTYPLPVRPPDSDFSFAFYANNGRIDLGAAADAIGFDWSVAARNKVLVDGIGFLNRPNSAKTNGDKSKAWKYDYESRVLPFLALVGLSDIEAEGAMSGDGSAGGKAVADYRNILDLLYIANSKVWFDPKNQDKYAAASPQASQDCWECFWELVEKNGIYDSASSIMREQVLDRWREQKKGNNIWCSGKSYVAWFDEVIPLLEQAGYPLYPEYLRLYPNQLERDDRYRVFREEEAELLEELEGKYAL